MPPITMFNSENLASRNCRKDSFYQSKIGHCSGLILLVRFVSACDRAAQLPPRPNLAMTASVICARRSKERAAFAKQCCVSEGEKSKVGFVPRCAP